ncbi:hypothetical protein PAECIP111891_00664 [Paenibacillus allorhizoplanae]|uniref:Uncharacterized protein n=1 Tax=Paenibacillus allorhizoplanae TaxID=2905648 RepID=A0ABM9BV76_9BACL|nr:hypothetical protein PAECIP111891_00664 [Paenibacillus allorhizoplanae]
MRIACQLLSRQINGKHPGNFSEIREMSTLDGFSTGNFSIIDVSEENMSN